MLSASLARKEHQRLRWRLLYGQAEQDIRDRVVASVGRGRTAAWGPLDLTANPFLSVWSQAAALYRTQPLVFAPPGGEEAEAALAESGHWSLAQRLQRDALALRESFVRIDIDPDTREVYTVPIAPFLVDVEVHPRSPYRAVAVTEERPDPEHPEQTVKVICDPRQRIYRAVDEHGKDVSGRVLGGDFSGEAYPFVGSTGPILPYVTYRAALSGSFWDSFTGRELVETSLQLGVLYTFLTHIAVDASWPQRYAVDLEPFGGNPTDDSGKGIVTDPATLLLLKSNNAADLSGQIGQWAASADPEAFLRMVRSYEQRAVDAALGTANVSRSQSDIRSSFSLAVSRDEQRDLQRSYEPVFRRSDLELLGKVSDLLGGPATGWRIEYKAIPKDPREHQAELDALSKAVEQGLMSRVDAYRKLHPQMSREEAGAAVAAIAQINRQYA